MQVNNVSIRTTSPDLVDFLYPTYTRLKEFSPFIEGGVIFDGDSKYLQSFRDAGIPYIYVKGTPEYDLTIPENFVEFVYNKWDKKPSKKVLEYISTLDIKRKNDLSELEDMCKTVWVTGKCNIEDEDETIMSNLYNLLSNGGAYDIIKEYLELSEKINTEKLFYNIQRFIENTNNVDNIKSTWVRNKVETFKRTRNKNVPNALMKYLYSKTDNEMLSMLKLLENITISS